MQARRRTDPKPARILFVGYDLLTDEDLADSLKHAGYEVVGRVCSSEEALQAVEQSKPDLILVDIKLTGETDGIETAQMIRTRFDIPLVYLTAHCDEDVLERAAETEPYGYVTKPIGMVQLKTTIETALHKHDSDKRLRRQSELVLAINQAQKQFIVGEDPQHLFDGLLDRLVSLTESEYGFIDEIFHTEQGVPFRRSHAVTNIAWDGETQKLYEDHRSKGFTFFNHDNLSGATMTTGRLVISNDPANDPRSGGLPEGHPALHSFLGLPLYSKDKLIGTMGLANRPGGYSAELADFLEPYLSTCAHIIESHRNEERRRQAIADLKASEKRFRTIFEEARDSLVLVDPETHEIVDCNKRAHVNLGFSREEFLKLRLEELEAVESSEEISEHIQKVLQLHGDAFDTQLRDKNGHLHDFAMKVRPVEIGGKQLLLGVWSDITERKRDQEALRESEELHRLTMSDISDSVFVTNGSGDFTYICPNTHLIFGYSQNEVASLGNIGKVLGRQLFDPDKLKEHREIRNIDWTVTDKYGNERHLLVTVKMVDIKGGTVLYTCRDITDFKEADAARRTSERQYRSIVETAIEGIWSIDSKGITTFVNENMAEMLGSSVEEMIGSPFFDFMDEKRATEAKRLLRRRSRGISEQHEFVFRHKNGGDVWTIVNTTSVMDDQGNFTGAFAMITDISSLKRSEAALIESASRWQLTFDAVKDSVCLLDLDMRIVQANKAAYSFIGKDPESIINRHCWEVVHGTREPLDQCPVVRSKQSLQREKSEFLVDDRWLDITADPILGHQGNITGFVHAVEDITARKGAEQAVQKERDKAQRYLDTAQVMMLAFDLEAKVTLANEKACHVLGYQKDKMLGKNWIQTFVPERFRKEVHEVFSNIMSGASDKYTYYENPILTKSGEERLIEWHNTSVVDESGKIVSVLASGKDITEHRAMERNLEQAYEELKSAHVETNGYLEASRSLLEGRDFESAARAIFDTCKRLTGATAGYVAIRKDDGWENEVLFLDSGGRECSVDPNLPMPIRGLLEKAYKTGRPVYDNTYVDSRWIEYMPEGHVTLDNAMFAPLILDGQVPGILGLANKPGGFTERDVKIAAAFGEYAAIGLKNSLAEEALKASEEKFRSAYEYSAVGMALVAPNGRFLTVNPAFSRILGYSEEEILDLKFAEIIDPQDMAESENEYKKLLSGETEYCENEKRYVHKDGHTVWGRLSVGLVRDESGDPKYAATQLIDVTDRKKRDQEILSTRAILAAVVENMPVAVFLKDAQSLRYRVYNAAAEELSGVSAQDALGKTDYDLFPQEQADFFVGKDKHVLESSTPCIIAEEIFESKHRGTKIFRTKKVPVFDDRGRPAYLLGIAEDITERKMAEAALMDSEAKHRRFAEVASEAVLFHDQGILLQANQQFFDMFGYEPEELIGKQTMELLLSPESVDLVRKKIISGSSGLCEAVAIRKDGAKFPVEVRARLSEFDRGAMRAVAMRDVSERKEMERRLIESQKMEAIGTLAGGIAHDFNNLLQIISGHAELLETELLGRGLRFSEMDAIRQSAERGADLVKQILTFSRRVESAFEVIDLNEDVKNVERLLYRTIPKMIDIELKLDDALKPVRADSNQIEQILLNLALNSNDAMPKGGKLTITTENTNVEDQLCQVSGERFSGQYVLLTVTDTGYGMSEDVMYHAFEPFFTTKGLAEGTGLGLATVSGIVKLHEGYIQCSSKLGKGTTFRIYFPLAEFAKPEYTAKVKEAGVLGGIEAILVVDDEPLIADLAKRILEAAGYSVFTATSGTEALDFYRRRKTEIELVILDLIMPEMGGEECLAKILRVDPQAKVLIASGFSAKGETRGFLDREAQGRVAKPFNGKELLRSVRHILDGA